MAVKGRGVVIIFSPSSRERGDPYAVPAIVSTV